VDVAELVDGVHRLIRPLCDKKGQHLELAVSPSVGSVYQDSGRLKQVLFNLLSNANKFTPDGGTVRTDVRSDGEWLEIAVSDTGIGIKPEDQSAVFEEFQQIDSGYGRQQHGTGLGLALVQRFARLMGGDIMLESEAGRG